MVMTVEAEEVPKTAERTPLISNDHHESSRIYLYLYYTLYMARRQCKGIGWEGCVM